LGRPVLESIWVPKEFRQVNVEKHIHEESYLRAWPYGGTLSLPDWAWRMLSRYEEGFQLDGRRELLFESAVILSK